MPKRQIDKMEPIKPLSIDEKISALVSLAQEPQPGDIMHWPNEDGAVVAFASFEFLESIKDNWKPK